MLDLKFVRENPDIVKKNIENKFQFEKLPLVDEVIELDAKNRAAKAEADNLRASRNKLSKQIGQLMGQGKKDEAEEVKAQVPLSLNEDIGNRLSLQKRIGIDVKKGGSLLPQKSMIALIGIGAQGKKKSCFQCRMQDDCEWKRRGKTCYLTD